MNKNVIIKIILGIILCIIVIFLGITFSKTVVEKKDNSPATQVTTTYELVYYDNNKKQKSMYEIKIDGNKIEYKQTLFCETSDCPPTTKRISYSFDSKYASKLDSLIKENFGSIDYKEVFYEKNLKKDQKKIINTIIAGEKEIYDLFIK